MTAVRRRCEAVTFISFIAAHLRRHRRRVRGGDLGGRFGDQVGQQRDRRRDLPFGELRQRARGSRRNLVRQQTELRRLHGSPPRTVTAVQPAPAPADPGRKERKPAAAKQILQRSQRRGHLAGAPTGVPSPTLSPVSTNSLTNTSRSNQPAWLINSKTASAHYRPRAFARSASARSSIPVVSRVLVRQSRS